MYDEQPTAETLFRQAPMTAHDYFSHAFGFAKQNPQLVAAYVMAACHDYTGSMIAAALNRVAEAITEAGGDE